MRAEPEIFQLLFHVLITCYVWKVKLMPLLVAAMRTRRIINSAVWRNWRLQARWFSEYLKSSLSDWSRETDRISQRVVRHVDKLLLPLLFNIFLDLVNLLLVYLISTIMNLLLRFGTYFMWSICSMILAPVLNLRLAFVWDIVEWFPWYSGGFS